MTSRLGPSSIINWVPKRGYWKIEVLGEETGSHKAYPVRMQMRPDWM